MRTSSVLCSTVVVALLASSACASALPYNEKQAATMSPEAVEKMKTLKVFRVPVVSPSDDQIRKVRADFAEIERGELEEMMKRFQPTIERTVVAGVKVVVITPKNVTGQNKDKVLLYIHGGGYVMGSATDRTGMLMANEMGLKMYSIDYDLAPEAKFPVALEQSLAVYKQVVKEHGADNIVGLSTSAGSGHMLAMLLKAQAQNLPMMRAMALLSPSVDLTERGDSVVANDGRDLLAYRNQADKFYIAPFVGTDANLEDPLISPIYGKYASTFPATVIVTGTRDVFLSGSTRLYWKLRAAKVASEMLVGEGMWHAFTNFPDIPEAIESRKASQEFLFAHLQKRAVSDGGAQHRIDASKSSASVTANIAIVRRFLEEVVNGGRIELLDTLWAKDLVWQGGSLGTVRGIDAFRKTLAQASQGSFTGMKLTVHDVVAEKDKVVVRFTNSGKQTGPFLGVPASGKQANWLGIGIYTLANGKIEEAWFGEDTLGMMLQLGAVRLPRAN